MGCKMVQFGGVRVLRVKHSLVATNHGLVRAVQSVGEPRSVVIYHVLVDVRHMMWRDHPAQQHRNTTVSTEKQQQQQLKK